VNTTEEYEIVDKLRSVLFIDDTRKTPGPVQTSVSRYPKWHRDIQLTETELDLKDWGVVYGMTFALLREKNPWHSLALVCHQAVDIAWRVYVEWGGEITEPDRASGGDELVLSADQRKRLYDELVSYEDGMTVLLEAGHGALLAVVNELYELRNDDPDHRLIRTSSVRVVRDFVETRAREIREAIAAEAKGTSADSDYVRDSRERLAVLESILRAPGIREEA
jgi:hypothetical protein